MMMMTIGVVIVVVVVIVIQANQISDIAIIGRVLPLLTAVAARR